MRMSVIAAAMAALACAAEARTTVTIACGSVGIEAELCREGAEAWARRTGHAVSLVSTPPSATDRLALFQQLLAARSSDIDVFQVDIVWPGMLAEHLVDLHRHLDRAEIAAHFPTLVAGNTVDGRLVAIPWFANAGLLYYRRDLLEKHGRAVPASWDELEETARVIMNAERAAGHERLWGFVFQARAYEGLTVNALEWLASHGGGRIVEPDGRITVANPRAAAALARAAGWIGTIAPRGVLTYAEEEARGVFQTGDAVFMRNWPYAWPLANAADSPVRGRVGVAVLPKAEGGRHAAGLGGEMLAVSRYSTHADAAVELVRYLTSAAEQKRRAIKGGFNPTLAPLYEDAEVLAANPFFGALREVFLAAVARPSDVTGARYNQVSAAFWNAVHSVLSGEAEARAALAGLERRLVRIRRGERW
ncbi:ABC transporter substrate-binding protein [Elioraea sp. Yellowstone]|jgi:trehalose/maltose transport system substrate-binding protein|uniref:ABC transporter substrate-binding protein n=1 Tax=Elioraea sp. Yellowstone TaxID=2592070 RepID=UPI00114D8397|nr:ABC transporter substrate-binding protein [Elioraea sp. Yellowstone]TQF84817.1 ABC transporter substrate-binding protein [Elioraea sp. Yellowstone]